MVRHRLARHYNVLMETASFAHPRRNIEALGVEPGMRIADFGSGSGAYVLAIAEILHGRGSIYAVDIQKDLLRRIKNEATRRSLEVEVVWGDLEEAGGSKIADGALDLVLISNLLFQVKKREQILKEAVRVLRGNGRVAVIDWSESFGHMGPHPEDVCAEEEALAHARAVGLTFVKAFDAGAHHYGLLFRKSGESRARS